MASPCPSPEAWTCLTAGKSPDEVLLAHLSSCPSCQDEVEALLKAEEAPAILRRPRWTYWSAAAALLLAVSLVWILRGGGLAPAAPRREPGRLLAIPGGGEALGAAGAALSVAQDGALVLRAGSVLCLSGAEPLRVTAGGRSILLRNAEGVIRLAPERAHAFLMAEAFAGAEALEVFVFSGSAEIQGGLPAVLRAGQAWSGSGIRPLRSGEALDLRRGFFPSAVPGAGVRLERGRPSAEGGWDLDAAEGRASCLFPAPADAYIFQVTLTGSPDSAFGLAFRVGGSETLWVPDRPLSDGAPQIFRVLVSSRWVSLWRDGGDVQRIPREGFRGNILTGISGVGVVASRGTLTLRGMSLEPIP